MFKSHKGIESKPSLADLSQLKVPDVHSGTSEITLKKISKELNEWGLNFALPIVCLTDEEDKYQLLTGLPIYEAAVAAKIDRIWVFLIVAKQTEAESVIEQTILQSKLNQRVIVIGAKDFEDFLKLIDTGKKTDLTSIPGVKDKYAKLIIDQRPYKCQEDLKKLGSKRPLNWLKAYTQTKTYK